MTREEAAQKIALDLTQIVEYLQLGEVKKARELVKRMLDLAGVKTEVPHEPNAISIDVGIGIPVCTTEISIKQEMEEEKP